MLLRKLLVLSGTGGLVEFTGPDCVLIIEPKNVASLHQGLAEALELLKAPNLLQEKLERAGERVAAFFPPMVTGQLESVYDLARGLGKALDD
jgi:glycosyltransferase involved in cell wall biosynthesis